MALRDAMEWKLQAPSISNSAKMAKGSFVVCRQSANLGSQVETVSLEGRRGAASAMTPPRNSSQRQRHDCEQLEGPWTTTTATQEPARLARSGTISRSRDDAAWPRCMCLLPTTRLAQMGLRGQEITSIAHCHCPPNGRTRPPVRRQWRGGVGEGCSASSTQLPFPPFSRRGPRNTYSRTKAPNSAITVFTTYSDLGSMAPCGLPWERVERREQMTTLVHHNGETTTPTTTTLSGWSSLQLGAWLPGRRRRRRCRWT